MTPTFFRFSGSGGTFQGYHNVKKYAQQHADDTGREVVIESAKGGRAWKRYSTVKPKAVKNPFPVGRLVTVKARRLRNGRVEIYRA